MFLIELIDIFDKLEKTSSRLEMTEIVSDFLKGIKDAQDLRIVVSLLQGQLDLDKLGVGEALIVDSLVSISGWTKDEVKGGVIQFGDVGSVAQEVLSKKRQASLFVGPIKYTLSDFYDNLRKLGETDSHKEKIQLLGNLFSSVPPKSAKYAARLILGILRVGVSTSTILDALAVGLAGDKKHKKDLQQAYNVMPSIGDVAVKLKDEGMDEISAVDAEYYTPVRPMLASRLKLDEIMDKMGDRCFAEYKLDGERAQIHVTTSVNEETKKEIKNVKIYSRQLTDITEQYPDIVRHVLANIRAKEVILDGEIVGYKSGKMLPFQVLMKRKRKHDIKEVVKEIPAKLYLFDVLKLGEKSQFKTPYMLRRDILGGLFADDENEIELVKHKEIRGKGQLVGFLQQARDLGYEGVVVKNDTSEYKTNKRCADWVKLKGIEGTKMLDTVDVVIIGGYHGKGRRAQMAGSFLCAVLDKTNNQHVAFTRVGSGFTDEVMIELSKLTQKIMMKTPPPGVFTNEVPQVWIQPQIVLELMCDEITRVAYNNDYVYSVRFPVFKSIRTDKGPGDVTTLQEIMEMHSKQ